MGETRRRDRLFVRGAAALAVVVAGALLVANRIGIISPQPGPLHAPGNATGIAVDGRKTVTAIFVLHDAELEDPIELTAARIVGADELLTVGAARMLVCDEQDVASCPTPHFSRRWPPRGALTADVDGFDIDDVDPVFVGVPVQVPEGPGRYSLKGLEVEYSQGGRRFRAEVGPVLSFVVRG